jgi:hypothetical protein
MKITFDTIDIEPYNHGLIIFCGDDFQDIKKHLNLKKNKRTSDWLKKDLSEIPDIGGAVGCVISGDKRKAPKILYIKRRKKRDWEFYSTIIHEVTHIVDKLLMASQADDEMEFRAYMTEYLFRKVRQTIK